MVSFFKSTSLGVFSAGLFAGWRAALVFVLIQSLHSTSVKKQHRHSYKLTTVDQIKS